MIISTVECLIHTSFHKQSTLLVYLNCFCCVSSWRFFINNLLWKRKLPHRQQLAVNLTRFLNWKQNSNFYKIIFFSFIELMCNFILKNITICDKNINLTKFCTYVSQKEPIVCWCGTARTASHSHYAFPGDGFSSSGTRKHGAPHPAVSRWVISVFLQFCWCLFDRITPTCHKTVEAVGRKWNIRRRPWLKSIHSFDLFDMKEIQKSNHLVQVDHTDSRRARRSQLIAELVIKQFETSEVMAGLESDERRMEQIHVAGSERVSYII